MLDILARKVMSAKRAASGMPVKKPVGVVSVKFKSERRKKIEEAENSVSSVIDSPAEFSEAVGDVPIIEDDIFEDDALWDLNDLTSKDDRVPFVWQLVQELSQTRSFGALSDIGPVQELTKTRYRH